MTVFSMRWGRPTDQALLAAVRSVLRPDEEVWFLGEGENWKPRVGLIALTEDRVVVIDSAALTGQRFAGADGVSRAIAFEARYPDITSFTLNATNGTLHIVRSDGGAVLLQSIPYHDLSTIAWYFQFGTLAQADRQDQVAAQPDGPIQRPGPPLRWVASAHPQTMHTRYSLASWSGRHGDATGAVQQLLQLLPDLLRVLGPDHPDTLTVRNDLAYWTWQAGDPIGAGRLYEGLLPDLVRVLGPDHPNTLNTRYNIASLSGQLGHGGAVSWQLQLLLPDLVRVLGPDHPDTLACRYNLAYWAVHAANPQAIGAQPVGAERIPEPGRPEGASGEAPLVREGVAADGQQAGGPLPSSPDLAFAGSGVAAALPRLSQEDYRAAMTLDRKSKVIIGAVLAVVMVFAGVPAAASLLPSSPGSATIPSANADLTATGAAVAQDAGAEGRIIPPVPVKGDGFEWLRTQSEHGPIRWSPCEPIHVVVNLDGAPDHGYDMVVDAAAEVEARSGLRILVEGQTEELPTGYDDLGVRDRYQPDRYGDRWAPVLVSWDALEGDLAGWAYPIDWRAPDGQRHWVSGEIQLDNAYPYTYRDGYWVLVHEFGHLLGLDHVEDWTQVMHDTAYADAFGDGDLAGFAAAGRGSCPAAA